METRFSEENFEVMCEIVEDYNKHPWDFENADNAQNAKLRSAIELLASKEVPDGLYAKGFCAYEGSLGFDSDFYVAEDCFLRFLKIKEDMQVINALGYIYYYGRTNNGEGEYTKAFDCFSLAAHLGHPEAKYKLADLYLSGKGVWRRSIRAAENIINSVYDEEYRIFCSGYLHGKFADVAIRMGNICKAYYDEKPDDNLLLWAYSNYKRAEYALKLRMADGGNFGDKAVKARLTQTINSMKDSAVSAQETQSAFIHKYPYPLFELFHNNIVVAIEITDLGNGDKLLTAKRVYNREDSCALMEIISIPELDIMTLTDTVVCVLHGSCNINISGGKIKFIADDYAISGPDNAKLCFEYKGNSTAVIECNSYVFRKCDYPEYKIGAKNYTLAKVITSKDNSDPLEYISEIDNLKPGDRVIVPCVRGCMPGEVIEISERTFSKSELPFSRYNKLLCREDEVPGKIGGQN